ncbi:unnamed protein product [Effrenium voratum]|nr:unnamed protein product [Effrenium voratum]
MHRTLRRAMRTEAMRPEPEKGVSAGGYMALPLASARDRSPSGDGGSVSRTASIRDSMRAQPAEAAGLSLDQYKQLMASAKLVGAMKFMELGKAAIEPNSVYGAAILMPQLARTARWHRSFLPHVTSSFFYLFLCMFVHASMLVYIGKELHVMNLFAGQMYLCDFGAELAGCTLDDSSESCVGPYGTTVTAPRLYSWSQLATRTFVRDSLVGVFPDQEESIRKVADPGEYGIESYYCRLLCCLVYVISIIQELDNIFNMMKLLYYIPTEDEPWFTLGQEDEDPASETMEKWLSQVEVKVAGMPRTWKIVNVLLVLVPKMMLWEMTASTGINFLMETGGIDDIIVNSVALGFMLQLDEVLTDAMMSREVNVLLDECKDYPLFDEGEVQTRNDEETLNKLEALKPSSLRLAWELIPRSLVLALLLLFYYVYRYYTLHCEFVDGRWVSKDMHLPTSLTFSIANSFLGRFFPVNAAEQPYWSFGG